MGVLRQIHLVQEADIARGGHCPAPFFFCVGRRGAGRVLFVYMGVCSLLSARVGAPAGLVWRRVVRYILKIVFF